MTESAFPIPSQEPPKRSLLQRVWGSLFPGGASDEPPGEPYPEDVAAAVLARVESVRFIPVRWSEGYDMDEVDAFLDRIAAGCRGEGGPTVEQIERQRFTPVRFSEGYDMDEVDTFVDEVIVPLLQGKQPSA